MKRYSIGLDFGSLSARAVLMDLRTTGIAAFREYPYPHGIMTETLPDGTPLPPDWAVQDPEDYWNALHALVPPLLAQAGVRPEEVAGIGLDTTSCTLLPTTAEGVPLCRLPRFAGSPHVYVKLWKHHAAQPWAGRMEELARERGEEWLDQFGGKISSEHYLPKAAQIAAEAPEVYQAAARIPQLGDWLVWRMCGEESRGYCAAAFKAYYSREKGDISPEFLGEIHPLLAGLHTKQTQRVLDAGDRAGCLNGEAARWMGLCPGTAVSASGVDAHVTLLGGGLDRGGELLLIIGTSTCAIVQSPEYHPVPGISGVVRDGILPGLYTYEGGQSCVGDLFAWFVERYVPEAYQREAAERGRSVHQLLAEKAAALRPGESGLVALDWWNGVRSTLMDFDLSGLIAGLTLDTPPEAVYRALIEATAFGANRIIQAMEEEGVRIDTLYAAGGIPKKNPLLAQVYADVCGREVRLVEQDQSGALGSAILGAAAAEDVPSGFAALPGLFCRWRADGCWKDSAAVYRPIPEHVEVYRELYALYRELYQYFGRESGLMKRLKRLKLENRR